MLWPSEPGTLSRGIFLLRVLRGEAVRDSLGFWGGTSYAPSPWFPHGALGVVPGAGDRDRTDLPDRVKSAGLKWKKQGTGMCSLMMRRGPWSGQSSERGPTQHCHNEVGPRDSGKIKHSWSPKHPFKKAKRHATDWEKIFQTHTSDKGLIPTIYKELPPINKKKTNKRGARAQSYHFRKEALKCSGST